MDLFRLQELHVSSEVSFLENATAAGTNTYTQRLPFESATVTMSQVRSDDQTVQDRKNESRPGYLGLREASLEFSGYVPGIMSDPGTGAPTANWFYTLLSDGLGGGLAADDGGTVTSATDGDTFVTTGVTALTPGSIIFVGSKGDARGDAQAGVVSTWAAGNTQLLNALPATPASPDAVRTGLNIYPTDAAPTVSKRFLLLNKTSGAVFQLMGCQLDSVSFEFPIENGGPIKYTLRYQAAYWEQTAASSPASLPSAATLPACDTAVIAGGSFVIQDFATTSRVSLPIRGLTLSLSMGLLAKRGPVVGQPLYTNIYGWETSGCKPTVSYVQAWSSSEKVAHDSDGSTSTHKQILFQSNATPGRRFAFYMPRAYRSGDTPQRTEVAGLLGQTVTLTGRESSTITSELTRSCIRFCLG